MVDMRNDVLQSWSLNIPVPFLSFEKKRRLCRWQASERGAEYFAAAARERSETTALLVLHLDRVATASSCRGLLRMMLPLAGGRPVLAP